MKSSHQIQLSNEQLSNLGPKLFSNSKLAGILQARLLEWVAISFSKGEGQFRETYFLIM